MKKCLWYLVMITGIAVTLLSCVHRNKTGPLLTGRAQEEQGDYLGALHTYQGIKQEGFRETCINNLYYLYGDIIEAMAAINEAEPPSAEHYYELGKTYYEKAQTFPDDTAHLSNMGIELSSYLAQKKERFQSQALESVSTSTQMHSSSQSLLLKGIIFEERDEAENAIQVYRQLLSIDTGNYEALYRLGSLLAQRGDMTQGTELLERAISKKPDAPEAHFALAEVRSLEGSIDPAVDAFEQTVCVEPRYTEAYYRLAQLYLVQDNLLDAERVMKLGVIQNPDSLQLGLFYLALESIMDEKEQREAAAIRSSFEGAVISDDLSQLDFGEESQVLQVRYLLLRKRLIQRQRPYFLSCQEEQENPYFENQLLMTDKKIEQVEQLFAATGEDAAEPGAENAENMD